MKKIFPELEGTSQLHLDVLNAILEQPGGMTIVDLMACEGSQTSLIECGRHIYVDLVKREIKNFHKEKDVFVQQDAIEFLKEMEFRASAITCLDGIEHLQKEDGLKLIALMEKKSDRQIIFTPLGDWLIEEVKTENPDSHKSGWQPEEFEALGYACLVFPNFHSTMGVGGLFAFKCGGLKEEFERVCAWCADLGNGLRLPPPIHENFHTSRKNIYE